MSNRAKILLFIVTVFNMIYNAFLPLHPDEAYYWVWSKKLQLSYFDHPPMIAYLIKLFTLFNQSEFMIRLVAVVCMTIAIYFIYKLAKELFNERVAEITLLLFLFLPITQIGYGIVTPDSPFILFWTLTVYLFYRGIFKRENSFLYLAGVTAGLMLLSKYPGVLLLASFFFFLLFSRYRDILVKKEVYLAFLLSIIVFLPVIIWNAQHDWVSFKFQLSHGLGKEKVVDLHSLGDFLGAQAGIVNPIFFLSLLFFAIRNIRDNLTKEKLAFLFWPFAFTFLFFAYGSLFAKSEANWTVPAYITGIILLAYWVDKLKNKWLYYLGIALTIILLMLVKFPEVFPFLPAQAVMKSQFYGYDVLFKEGSKYIKDKNAVILSDRYQNASEAWYYLEGKPPVYILTPARVSNYTYWKDELNKEQIKEAVFFGEEDNLEELKKIFERVELVDVLKYDNRFIHREYKVYKCYN